MTPPIKVKKDELLGYLQENRAKHRAVFEEALAGWRKQADRELQHRHDALRAGKIPSLTIHLVTPQDHTKDYDRVIKMVQMHVGDEYPLDEQTFAQFVMDDWAWRRQFLSTSSTYAAAAVLENYGDDIEE